MILYFDGCYFYGVYLSTKLIDSGGARNIGAHSFCNARFGITYPNGVLIALLSLHSLTYFSKPTILCLI